MPSTHCPICYTALETREVAPCWDCGHLPNELAECAAGEHECHECRAFGALPVVLCDFCFVNFASYYASYFGLDRTGILGDLPERLRSVIPDAQPHKDKYCPECGHRLAFLQFRAAAIELPTKRNS